MSASYLDSYLNIDSDRRLRTKLFDQRYYFNFLIVNFPFICRNIPEAHAYGVYISQLIGYSRVCGSYQDFLDRGLLPTRKPLNQVLPLVNILSSPPRFGLPLWNVCVTKDQGYVPLVVNTSRSFPHSRLIT